MGDFLLESGLAGYPGYSRYLVTQATHRIALSSFIGKGPLPARAGRGYVGDEQYTQ